MFEKASRIKLRFNYCGTLFVEDLWDLSLKDLDALYRTLRQAQKAPQEESLLKETTEEDAILCLQIDIVKYIVKTRLAENAAKEKFAVLGELKQAMEDLGSSDG